MQFKTLSFAAFAAMASAQSLLQVLQSEPSLSNLTTYLGLFPGFESTVAGLTNVTLLAPNNDAFAAFLKAPAAAAAFASNDSALIEAIFSYHVLNGSYANFSSTPAFIPTALMPGQYANVTGGQVVEAIGNSSTSYFYTGLLQNATTVGNASNYTGGVVHIIDSLLNIPLNISQTAVDFGLSSIVGALAAEDLATAVDGLSDVTAFIPNNAAFQAIAGSLGTLSSANLTSILEYHIINGTVGYSTILSNMTLTTLQGGDVHITIENGTVFVNSAKVVLANVLVANGVVHVLDGVLNPSNSTATPDASMSTPAPAFGGAMSGTAAPFTSNVPTPTSSIDIMATPGASGVAGVGSGAGAGAGAGAGSGSSSSSSSSSGGAMPMKTGAIAAAALFGGAAAVMNM